MSEAQPEAPLRRGWTTGACASGAARAAFEALLTGIFPDPVPVALPKGLRPEFALATHELGDDWARAGIVKDAGDDPDVTHGALIVATVRFAPIGAGVEFRAGEGVGTVTRPGLPLPPGEPAINPAPRAMIRANLDGGRRTDRRRLRCGGRDFRAGRRKNRRAHRQRPARHRRRPVDPRHDRRRRALFLLGLDPFDPPRNRRRAGERLRPCGSCDRRHLRSGDPRPSPSARSRADRHGRLRRRPAEISARPSGPARHDRRRPGEDDQARARAARSPFEARDGRSSCARPARRRGGRAGLSGGSDRKTPTARCTPSSWPQRAASTWPR